MDIFNLNLNSVYCSLSIHCPLLKQAVSEQSSVQWKEWEEYFIITSPTYKQTHANAQFCREFPINIGGNVGAITQNIRYFLSYVELIDSL